MIPFRKVMAVRCQKTISRPAKLLVRMKKGSKLL